MLKIKYINEIYIVYGSRFNEEQQETCFLIYEDSWKWVPSWLCEPCKDNK